MVTAFKYFHAWTLVFAWIYSGQGQHIKITMEPFDISRAQALQQIHWRVPFGDPVYCVADSSVSNLRFSCPDCSTGFNTSSSLLGTGLLGQQQPAQQFSSNQNQNQNFNPQNFPTQQAQQQPQPTPFADIMSSLASEVNSEFQLKTLDRSSQAGFPVILLNRPRISSTLNGKTLRCEGYYRSSNTFQQNQQQQQFGGNGAGQNVSPTPTAGTESQMVHADAVVSVSYIRQPRILNQYGQGPVHSDAVGNRFYVQPGQSLSLTCYADANPPASMFKWWKDGAVFATTQQIQVNLQSHGGSSIACRANNGMMDGDGQDSGQVRIEAWDPPRILQTNYGTNQNNPTEPPPSGLRNDGKVVLQSTVVLKCIAKGNPKPVMFWRQALNSGEFRDALCLEGQNSITAEQAPTVPLTPQSISGSGQTQFTPGSQSQFQGPPQSLQQPGQQQQLGVPQNPQAAQGQFGPQQSPGQFVPPQAQGFSGPNQPQLSGSAASGLNVAATYLVQTVCSVPVRDYNQSGQYFCMACSQYADGAWDCDPRNMTLPQNPIVFDVVGAPLLAPDTPRVEQQTEGGEGRIYVNFCSDPPPSESFWEVDGRRILPDQKVDTYTALRTKQNNTFSDCYESVLVLDPVQDSDHTREFYFVAVNSLGRIREPLRVPFLGDRTAHGANVGLAVGLAIGLLLLVLLTVCGMCWWRRAACFASDSSGKNLSRKNIPAVKAATKYPTNLAPSVRLEPAPVSKPPLPGINDSFGNGSTHSDRTSSDLTGVVPVRGSHEGLTYAELDLVKDSQRVPPPSQGTYRPAEYVSGYYPSKQANTTNV